MKYLPLSGVKKNRTDFEKLQEDYWYYLPVPQRESLIVKIFANYMSEDIRLNATLFFCKRGRRSTNEWLKWILQSRREDNLHK